MAKAQSKTKAKAAPKKAPAKAPAKVVKKPVPAKTKASPAKTVSKAPPAKVAAKASVKPPAKGSVKPRAKIEFGATEEKKRTGGPVDFGKSGIRAHADSGLTKIELELLYKKLIEEKARKEAELGQRVNEALAEDDILADEIDIAQRSTDQAWIFRFADKERKLLIEIDGAIEKMRTGEYGICEGTDEAIGFKRLELRPWTRYSVAHKELLEREKQQQAR